MHFYPLPHASPCVQVRLMFLGPPVSQSPNLRMDLKVKRSQIPPQLGLWWWFSPCTSFLLLEKVRGAHTRREQFPSMMNLPYLPSVLLLFKCDLIFVPLINCVTNTCHCFSGQVNFICKGGVNCLSAPNRDWPGWHLWVPYSPGRDTASFPSCGFQCSAKQLAYLCDLFPPLFAFLLF